MKVLPDSNLSERQNRTGAVLSFVATILVLLALQSFVFWLLLLLRATIYQQQLFLLAFVFSMMYPVVHVSSMYAVIGPGALWQRQIMALASLLIFMALALLISFAMYRLFFAEYAWTNLVQQPVNRGGVFDWIRLSNQVTLFEGLAIFWSAIPGLFVICQIPYWIWAQFPGKPQLIKGVRREIRPVSIADLLLLTAMVATAFAGFSYSLSHSINENKEVFSLLRALLGHLIYANFSFLIVCLPMIILILERNNRTTFAQLFDKRSTAVILLVISLVTFIASIWAMLNRMAVSWSFVFLIVAPFVTLGFPCSLLILQLSRNGFELSVNRPSECHSLK